MKFKIGDRVKTTVHSPPAWKGAWTALAGLAGVVTAVYPRWSSYAVLLDSDPDQMALAYGKDELEAES